MLDHGFRADVPLRWRPAPVRVAWPARALPPPARETLARKLLAAAMLAFAGAALLISPRLRFRFAPRWWPSFLAAARAAGPRAVVWTVVWSTVNGACWLASAIRNQRAGR